MTKNELRDQRTRIKLKKLWRLLAVWVCCFNPYAVIKPRKCVSQNTLPIMLIFELW